MKKISYRHKKIAAEKDSKDLSGVYFRAVRNDAEKDLPESPLGAQESRRDYFQRLNNLIETNKEIYDDAAPFGRDAITFVGTIPESELESLSKGDRLAFVKWVASNYSEFSGVLTLDNISKIRSFIDAHPEYTFLTINEYSPGELISLIEEAEEAVKTDIPDTEENLVNSLNIDQDKFNYSSDILSEENIPDLISLFSEREILMLKLGASLTDKVNNLSLILDFLFAENSDIEIKKPGDLESLYSFDLQKSESIISSFNALDANQVDWHINTANEAGKASSDSGDYGYGYLTNIVVYQFDDGWKIVYLPAASDPEAVMWDGEEANSYDKNRYSHDRIQEGNNNGLCLGSISKRYNLDNSYGFVYSLRDPSNKPIATIRINADFREKSDFSNERVMIHEIKEKYNATIGIESSMYITKFFNSINLDRKNYRRIAKDVSEEGLLDLIRIVNNPLYHNSNEIRYDAKRSAEDMFAWIYFLNKKRSDKKESKKYQEYLKHYNSLIEARNLAFNDDNGLFFNTTSITLDKSRAKEYILNICKKIIQAGNGSFLQEDLIAKLFSKDIKSEIFKKFYNNTLSKSPEYKRALEILSINNPGEVYSALCNTLYNNVSYLYEYGMVSAKILLSGGRESLDKFFSPLKGYKRVFYDESRSFHEEYKNENVIKYIEDFFNQDKSKFNEQKFFMYYFGNNLRILKLKRNYINAILQEELAERKEEEGVKGFSPSILDYVFSQKDDVVNKNLIDKNLAYNIAKYIEDHIMAGEGSYNYDKTSFSKYIFFKKISGYSDDFYEFSDEAAIEKTLDKMFTGIHRSTSIKQVSDQFIDFFDPNIFSLDLISDILVPKLTQKIDNIFEDKDAVRQLVLKKMFNIITNHLSKAFNLNLDDLINKTSVSNQEIASSFSENPKLFFETDFKNAPDLYELKKELALLSLKHYFDSAKGHHTTYQLEYESQDMVDIVSSIKEDREALDSLFNQLLSHIDAFSISDEEFDFIILKNISGKIDVLSAFSEELKKEKLLEKYAIRVSNTLSRFADLISKFATKDPRLFYSERMFDIPGVKANRAEVAKALLETIVADEYKYDKDLIPIILEDLGLSKQARVLYKYFVKNNYFDEAKSLISIY